jgi:8-oxo-dGTP diphosphatase
VIQKIAAGVKAMIMRDEELLVLVKPNGALDLPGGRVEDGEDLCECLLREISEETALKVEIFSPITFWSFMKSPLLLIEGVTYKCQYLNGNVTLSSEHSDYSWMKPVKIEMFKWKRPFFGGKRNDTFNWT